MLVWEGESRFRYARDARACKRQAPRWKKVLHWLMLVTASESVPKSVFGTEHAFDVLWGPDSEHFAITHYPGGNKSEVLAVATRDGAKEEIAPRAAASPYFVDGISERTVAKAYRWTTDGALVVRGLSRAEKEPYDLVGFEILADVKGTGGQIRLRFLSRIHAVESRF